MKFDKRFDIGAWIAANDDATAVNVFREWLDAYRNEVFGNNAIECPLADFADMLCICKKWHMFAGRTILNNEGNKCFSLSEQNEKLANEVARYLPPKYTGALLLELIKIFEKMPEQSELPLDIGDGKATIVIP